MKQVYMSVAITRYTDDKDGGYAFIYRSGYETVKRVSVEEGLRVMRKLEKLFGYVARMEVNPYNRAVVNHEINGWIEI